MPKAVVYTAPECPHSRRLVAFLKQNKIDFEERCILASPGILDELKRVSGQLAVPVTVIGDGIFLGFDSRVERRIKRQVGV
ncbi:MAG: NrdH-redoxin [Candidatus Thorarchaeota archaeon]|nr:MAG: NrdH-redoxin [Candidatus Thorarchaeota archaeon]